MMKTYARWLLRWRYPVILLVLALCAWAASGIRLLDFRTDYRMFFSEDNPQLIAFESLQKTYARNDGVLLVVAPKDGRVFTRETLALLETLTRAAWQVPHSRRVDSLTNFQHSHANGDELVVEDLVRDAARLSDADIERIRSTALAEPLLVNALVSAQGHVAGINVTVQLPGVKQSAEVLEAAKYARRIVAETCGQQAKVDCYLTGTVMMDNAFADASERDASTLTPLMLVIIIVALGLFLRAVSGTALIVVLISLAIVCALGLAGWLGITLSPTSIAAPTILLTLAVADSVHILVSFFHHLENGMDKDQAMAESLDSNLAPVFFTTLTTAIGFLTMNFSEAPPFRDLGNITAIGVVVTFVLTMTLLPAAVTALPVRVRPRAARTHAALGWLAERVIRSRGKLLWGLSLVFAALIAFIPRNELNDEFVKYFGKNVEFRQATDFTTENLTGIYTIEYSLGAGREGGITDPAFLQKVDQFVAWYRQQPETLHVNSITEVFKKLNRNMHQDDPAWQRLPAAQDLASQYLLMYEMSLPQGLDLNDRVNVDKSATRVTVTLRSLSSNELLALDQRAQAWLRDHAPASMQVKGTGPALMFANIGQRNIVSMLEGEILSMTLISLILIFVLRSVKIGLLSLIPNLLPAGVAFGLWGLFVGELGLAGAAVAAMTLGILVDDTVHSLSKYLRGRRKYGLDPQDAVRYMYSSAAPALIVTSIVLIAGFAVLAFSSFRINSDMGLLTAIILALGLVADLLLLPPLLLALDRGKAAAPASYPVADVTHPAADVAHPVPDVAPVAQSTAA